MPATATLASEVNGWGSVITIDYGRSPPSSDCTLVMRLAGRSAKEGPKTEGEGVRVNTVQRRRRRTTRVVESRSTGRDKADWYIKTRWRLLHI
jgi:hypothetical protein